jgi:enoyl-CoA hydratase/carnithine racemase
LNNDVLQALTDALRDAKSDSALRAIVLTGAGDKAFAQAATSRTHREGRQRVSGAAGHRREWACNVLRRSRALHAPLIARVNGHAVVGGLGLVAACDFAIAADDALFATPEVKVGLYPMLITAYLMRLVPRRKLVEMSLTGESLSAERAVEYGLLNAAVPRAELDARVNALIATLSDRSPTAIRLGKHALHAVQDMTLPQCLDYMTLMLDRLVLTDSREVCGVGQAKPAWSGR